jgi:hypothetical protein
MNKSTCCNQDTIQIEDKCMCSGVDGCGKWCKSEEKQSNPLIDYVYFLKHTPYYRLYDVLYNNEDASKAFLDYIKSRDNILEIQI